MKCVSGRALCCPEKKLEFQEVSLLHLQFQNRKDKVEQTISFTKYKTGNHLCGRK